jgi:hypothetical protein
VKAAVQPKVERRFPIVSAVCENAYALIRTNANEPAGRYLFPKNEAENTGNWSNGRKHLTVSHPPGFFIFAQPPAVAAVNATGQHCIEEDWLVFWSEPQDSGVDAPVMLAFPSVEWPAAAKARISCDIFGDATTCRPTGAGDLYRCDVDGRDLSQVVLYNGGGRATADAPSELVAAESHAKAERLGVWKKQAPGTPPTAN